MAGSQGPLHRELIAGSSGWAGNSAFVPSRGVNPRRCASLSVLAAAFASFALLAPQVGSGSMPVDCREVTCSATFDVGKTARKWASPEAFYPNNEQVFAALATARGPLTLLRTYGAEMCRHRFFGGGISALVKACGDMTPVRVRAVQLKRGARARPRFRGVLARSDAGPAADFGPPWRLAPQERASADAASSI